MSKPKSILFTWEGTDNPNDPEGVAGFQCNGIAVSVGLNDFATASKLAYLLHAAYELGKNDAIDKAAQTIPKLLNEQRYD
jgi:hypothetical protein